MAKFRLFILLTFFLTACAPATATQPPASPSPTVDLPSPVDANKLGDTTVSPADGVVLVYIPAGEFIMGDDHGMTDEQPAHPIYLDAYWLDRTEVTNEAYRKCVETGACDVPTDTSYYDDPSYANHPVVFVSWRDAVSYCSFVGKRLPTEAQWA